MILMCRVGLHKWRDLGSVGIVMQWQVQQCQRCGCGREIGLTGTFYCTPEQMRAALLAAQEASRG